MERLLSHKTVQFKVPQNVQREDQIVGPLTLRQLIICGIGGGLAYAVYIILGREYELITTLPPVIIIAAITLLFAFIKPLDLTFAKFLLVYLEFMLLPKKRYWILASAEALRTSSAPPPKSKAQKKAEEKAEQVVDKAQKIQEISKMLDSQH
jgi:hypothetical protein